MLNYYKSKLSNVKKHNLSSYMTYILLFLLFYQLILLFIINLTFYVAKYIVITLFI